MTYNIFKMIHTIIGGLILGSGFSFLILFASLRASGHVMALKVFTHWNLRLFWLLGLPLFVFQIILALILISLKIPAVSSHAIGILFLESFFLFSLLLTALFFLKTRFQNVAHDRLQWVLWVSCCIVTGCIVGIMIYQMIEIGTQGL